MSRLVNRSVTVVCHNDDPSTIIDGDHQFVVAEGIDQWIESGMWIEHEPNHHVFRALTVENAVLDVERVGESWSIYRVWD